MCMCTRIYMRMSIHMRIHMRMLHVHTHVHVHVHMPLPVYVCLYVCVCVCVCITIRCKLSLPNQVRRLRAGQGGGVILIEGEAGMGKTALLDRALSFARAQARAALIAPRYVGECAQQ